MTSMGNRTINMTLVILFLIDNKYFLIKKKNKNKKTVANKRNESESSGCTHHWVTDVVFFFNLFNQHGVFKAILF